MMLRGFFDQHLSAATLFVNVLKTHAKEFNRLNNAINNDIIVHDIYERKQAYFKQLCPPHRFEFVI